MTLKMAHCSTPPVLPLSAVAVAAPVAAVSSDGVPSEHSSGELALKPAPLSHTNSNTGALVSVVAVVGVEKRSMSSAWTGIAKHPKSTDTPHTNKRLTLIERSVARS